MSYQTLTTNLEVINLREVQKTLLWSIHHFMFDYQINDINFGQTMTTNLEVMNLRKVCDGQKAEMKEGVF